MIPPKSMLNERQREAVLHTEGPLIVLAGAGSGKTKMLTSRIAHLMEGCGVPGHQILAMTFTNKAAAEMRQRVEKLLGAPSVLSWGGGDFSMGIPEIGTFHSVCIRILRREIAKTPFSRPFVIYDDSDQLHLIKTVFEQLQINEKAFNPKSIQIAINRAKCDAKEPHEMDASHEEGSIFSRQVKRVYEQYQKELLANHALDFGEIICMTYRLFRDHPDLRKKYQQRYCYIHVDEYQDTNRSQYLLLSSLASATLGGHQNICVVGDEDQSIYKWRGADIRNILDFEKDYPGAKIVKLEQNYRSTQMILAAASYVIQNNRSRKDKRLWTENAEGHKVIRAQLADERAEAEMTVSEIKRVAEQDGRAYGDFAIFYRTNAQSRQFEDVLRREKIPYQLVGGLKFYDRKEIKDILAYFKVILNPFDSVSLKRVINVPARGIGKTTLEKLEQVQFRGGHSSPTFWDVLEKAAEDSTLTSSGTSKKIAKFVELVRRWMSEQPKLLLTELYHLILDETGYIRDLQQEGTEEARSRIENLEEFGTLLQEFEEDQLGRFDEETQKKRRLVLLPIFIEQSTLASDIDQLEGEVSSVKLMTLHSSKGLEFPVAFIVGMEEGLFPSIKLWEKTPEEDIEEERRLCYVGMTRAREILYLMNVVVRRIWGNVNYPEPSRFFSEIPRDCLEFKDFSQGLPQGLSQRLPQKFQSRPHSFGLMTQVSSSSAEDWVGRPLLHPEYGKGTVVATEGSGNDQKVTIQFIKNGQRKFLLRYISSYFGS